MHILLSLSRYSGSGIWGPMFRKPCKEIHTLFCVLVVQSVSRVPSPRACKVCTYPVNNIVYGQHMAEVVSSNFLSFKWSVKTSSSPCSEVVLIACIVLCFGNGLCVLKRATKSYRRNSCRNQDLWLMSGPVLTINKLCNWC